MAQLRLFSIAAIPLFGLLWIGCGGSDEKYYIPADNQIRPFVAPDAEELSGEDDEAGEVLEEGGGAAVAPEPAAPAPAAPAAAAEPVKGAPAKPGKSKGKSESE